MTTWWGLLDAAQDERLYPAVAQTPCHACLFAGKLDPAVAQAAPYLVDLDAAPALGARWRTDGWGANWGVVCRSNNGLAELRRHFRRFLLSQMPDGSAALFRFYDPRVFRTYLPTADGAELRAWFAGIEEFVVVAEDGAGSHRLLLHGDTLVAQPPLPAH